MLSFLSPSLRGPGVSGGVASGRVARVSGPDGLGPQGAAEAASVEVEFRALPAMISSCHCRLPVFCSFYSSILRFSTVRVSVPVVYW